MVPDSHYSSVFKGSLSQTTKPIGDTSRITDGGEFTKEKTYISVGKPFVNMEARLTHVVCLWGLRDAFITGQGEVSILRLYIEGEIGHAPFMRSSGFFDVFEIFSVAMNVAAYCIDSRAILRSERGL